MEKLPACRRSILLALTFGGAILRAEKQVWLRRGCNIMRVIQPRPWPRNILTSGKNHFYKINGDVGMAG